VTPDSRKARLARNEAFFREVNERIRDIGADFAEAPDETYDFVCECPDPACVDLVQMTVGEYEAIRSSPRRFVVAPGHEIDEIEHVVEVNEGSEVVEKHGVAGEVAAALDPRR